MDYTKLSLAEIASALDAVAADARTIFGALDRSHVNRKPAPSQWSVAECFDHLLRANHLMRSAAEAALSAGRPTSVWERLTFLAALFGPMLVRSQAPETSRKYTAPAPARPAGSNIRPDVIDAFAEQQRESARWVATLEPDTAAHTIMTSPFVRVITYSVLDGCRLMVAHNHRHVEQAKRAMQVSL